MTTWVAVLGAAAVAFALKLLGHLVPASVLRQPRVAHGAALLPAAVATALVVVLTPSTGDRLVVDARLAGLAAAAVALLLRAPFLLVVVVAAATAAALRAAGVG
ncbi:AzlD domain-containing protein [Angustibacter aerolatus]